MRGANPAQLVVVTGKGREQVEAHLAEIDSEAHAGVPADARRHRPRRPHRAWPHLTPRRPSRAGRPIEGTVIIAPGDTPLLSAGSVRSLAAHRAKTKAPGVVLSAKVPDPTGYGRIVRDRWGHLKRIVEQADATEAEREITEINSGVYAFDAAKLRAALAQLTRDNAQGEEYLPDVIKILVKTADPVGAALIDDWHEVAGVNDRVQLSQARSLLRDRILVSFMRAGVTVIDPATTWVDVGVALEPDCVVLPNTMLLGRTTVATGAHVGPNCSLRDTVGRAKAPSCATPPARAPRSDRTRRSGPIPICGRVPGCCAAPRPAASSR